MVHGDRCQSWPLQEDIRGMKREKETRYEAAMAAYLSKAPTILSDGRGYPSRESLYDR